MEEPRVLHKLVRAVRSALRGGPRDRVGSLIADFNALSLPRGYLCIVGDDLVCYVVIFLGGLQAYDGPGVLDAVDVIVVFDAPTGRWSVHKNRAGLTTAQDPSLVAFAGGMSQLCNSPATVVP